MPQLIVASPIDWTMAWLSLSRSLNVASSTSLPISERMVVWASCATANSAFSTPYEARYGSLTL